MKPARFFGGMVVSYLVLAVVMAILLTGFSQPTALTGVALGALLWLGPASAIGMTAHLASDKPIGIYLIDVGCQLVYLLLMGVLLGAWRFVGAPAPHCGGDDKITLGRKYRLGSLRERNFGSSSRVPLQS